ncbi:MAG: hypothetical protein II875_05930 [Clostridia bacterium]|nr:hypothetical protein [Clostridia bacterium]
MTRLEMVEKLREKADVTYDEARDALEKNDWDMLDALLALKSKKSTAGEKPSSGKPEIVVSRDSRAKEIAGSIGEKASSVVRFLLSAVKKGEDIRIEVLYRDEVIGSLSVTVLALLLICSWFVPVILFILGLISGYRFRFSNKTLTGKMINTLGSDVLQGKEKGSEKELEILHSGNKEG